MPPKKTRSVDATHRHHLQYTVQTHRQDPIDEATFPSYHRASDEDSAGMRDEIRCEMLATSITDGDVQATRKWLSWRSDELEDGAWLNQHVQHNGSVHFAPIHFAVLANDHEVLALLFDAGADVDFPDTDGVLTPLHLAAHHGHVQIVESTIPYGQPIWAGQSPPGQFAHLEPTLAHMPSWATWAGKLWLMR